MLTGPAHGPYVVKFAGPSKFAGPKKWQCSVAAWCYTPMPLQGPYGDVAVLQNAPYGLGQLVTR